MQFSSINLFWGHIFVLGALPQGLLLPENRNGSILRTCQICTKYNVFVAFSRFWTPDEAFGHTKHDYKFDFGHILHFFVWSSLIPHKRPCCKVNFLICVRGYIRCPLMHAIQVPICHGGQGMTGSHLHDDSSLFSPCRSKPRTGWVSSGVTVLSRFMSAILKHSISSCISCLSCSRCLDHGCAKRSQTCC